jgi:signal transduction histidine kinase
VTVTDNGGGIPQGLQARIFERYVTTKGADVGTGLGLFIAKMIVEQRMQGTLTVCNVQQGACFCIELPLSDPVPAAD